MRPKQYTTKQLKAIKTNWHYLKKLDSVYWDFRRAIERAMQKMTGIKDIELIDGDDGVCGVGTADRKYKLLQERDLE